MIIYIASSFDEAERCEAIRHLLESLGHSIPDVWWNVRTKDDFANAGNAEFYGDALVQSIAARHWRTIKECDALIIVSSESQPRTFTGANVELGYALALGKPVLSVGMLKRSAMYVPVIRCAGIDELLRCIQCIGQVKR